MSIRVDPNGFSQERVHRSVFSILRGNVLCSTATVTEENKAHINTAYFCYSDDLELYFLSDPGSIHCRNLSTNSSMAVTVFRSSQRWGGPDEGLQLFGTCTKARGPQATKAQRLYRERFPAYAEWVAGLREKKVGRGYRFFRFLTDRLKVLDERNFGDAVFVTAAVTRGRRSPRAASQRWRGIQMDIAGYRRSHTGQRFIPSNVHLIFDRYQTRDSAGAETLFNSENILSPETES